MNKNFYISFMDIAHNTGNYPNDIRLKKILNCELAIEYVENEYKVLEEFSFDSKKWTKPLLVTNDRLLSRKYRNVFNENEFKSYCIESSLFGNQIEKLPLVNQVIANQSNLTGKIGKEAFEHFMNIKENKYKEAYMYSRYRNSWIDEDTGTEYDYDEESGWTTRDWVDIDDDCVTPL